MFFIRFGKVPNLFSIDDLKCTGSETRITDCPHDSLKENCSEGEGAGVICNLP